MSSRQTEFEDQVSMTSENGYISDSGSDSGSDSAVSDHFRVFTENGMVRLDEDSTEHDTVTKSLRGSMGIIAGMNTEVVAVHKNVASDSTSKARLETFQIFSRAVAKKHGGNPNINHAWYAGSKSELCEIAVHGFSRCGQNPSPNSPIGGVGIHLFHARCAHVAVKESAVDVSGLQHLLLCRVIVGKPEVVAPGSDQSHPSSQEADIGIDNLTNPTRYVVWSASMNSHIMPAFVISFKAPPPPPPRTVITADQLTQAIAGASNPATQAPVSGVVKHIISRALNPRRPMIMTFAGLINLLSRFLPRPQALILAKSFEELKRQEITRREMIQKVREVAGVRLLTAVLKAVRYNMRGLGLPRPIARTAPRYMLAYLGRKRGL